MMGRTTWIGALFLLSNLYAAETIEFREYDPEALVRQYCSPAASAYEREQIAIALRNGYRNERSIAPILDAVMHERLFPKSRARLIGVLAEIGDERAGGALRALLYYFHGDPRLSGVEAVQSWSRLAERTLGDEASPAGKRLAGLLPYDARRLLETAATGKELSDADKIAILDGLNALLANPGLYDSQVFRGLPLAADVLFWLGGKERSFQPAELRWWNRRLLEAALPGVIPEKSPEKNADRRGIETVLQALAKSRTRTAVDALLQFLPFDDATAVYHIEALARLDVSDAERMLAEYLLSDNRLRSLRTREALETRRKEIYGFDLGEWCEDTIRQASRRQAVPPHAGEYLGLLVLEVEDEQDRADLAAQLLRDGPALQAGGIRVIARQPNLLRTTDVLYALEPVLLRSEKDGPVLEILDILRRARIPASLPAAAYCLEHPSRRVRAAAAQAMASITGLHLGNNPHSWKTWYRQQVQAAAENAEKGAPAAEENAGE